LKELKMKDLLGSLELLIPMTNSKIAEAIGVPQ
jgi:hypothetical protein